MPEDPGSDPSRGIKSLLHFTRMLGSGLSPLHRHKGVSRHWGTTLKKEGENVVLLISHMEFLIALARELTD